MKSMSMVDQGNCSLNCVCRCSNGLSRDCRPAIHMRAGEKVCIQVMRPTQFFELFASRHNCRIESLPVITGLARIFTGICEDVANACAIAVECSSTCFRVSGP